MPTVKLPFSGGVYDSVDELDLANSDAAPLLQNMLINEANSNITRPGLKSDEFSDVTTPAIGMTTFRDHLIVATVARKVWSIDRFGTATDVTGTSLTGSLPPIFASDGDTLAIADGGTPIKYTGTGTTSPLDGSPPTCSHIVYLDGYFIANDLGTESVYFAGPTPDDRLVWADVDTFASEASPDKTRVVIESNRELYLIGDTTTEIYNNFGDVDVPFQRIFFLERGTSAPYSVVRAMDTIWFIDQSRRFVKIEGRIPVTISTPIDREIKQMSKIDDCRGDVIEIGNQYLIVWTFEEAKRTFCYNYQNQKWSEFTGFKDGIDSRFRMKCHAYDGSNNRHLIGDYSDGSIWEMSFDSKTDGPDSIKRLRRTGPIDHGTTLRKRSNELRIACKRGEGATADTEPQMQIRVRDNFGQWSNPKRIGLGKVGDRNQLIRLKRNGIYRQRQYEILVTDAVDFTLHSGEEDIDLLGS